LAVFRADAFFDTARFAFLTGPFARLATTFFAVFRFAFLAIAITLGCQATTVL